MKDKVNSLKGLDEAIINDTEVVRDNVQSVAYQVSVVLEDLQSEQRTAKMQNYMINRLKEEISECRVETAKITVLADQAKHDYLVVSNSLQNNKQDLLEDEIALEKLHQSIKSKREQREVKLSMLNSITIEGENSVAKLQHSLFANSPVQSQVIFFHCFHFLKFIMTL